MQTHNAIIITTIIIFKQQIIIGVCIEDCPAFTEMLQKGKQGLGPHQESREASFSTVSTVGSKSRALLSRPKSSAMRSAPYMSPYLLITYTLHREDSSDRRGQPVLETV